VLAPLLGIVLLVNTSAQAQIQVDAANRAIADQLQTINGQLRAAAAEARVTTRGDLAPPQTTSPALEVKTSWRSIKTPFGSIKVAVPEVTISGQTPTPPASSPPPSEARDYAAKIEADAETVADVSAAVREGRTADIQSHLGEILLSPESAATLRAPTTETSSSFRKDLASLVFVLPGVDGGFTLDYTAVGLLVRHGSQNEICTGTLVRPNVVLTAAHCFCRPGTLEDLVADTFDKCMTWVDRPDADQYSFFISGAGLFGVRDYRIHNNYSFFNLRGDIALLSIEPVSGVSPLEISTDPVAEGTTGRLLGYGMRAIRSELVQVAVANTGTNTAVPLISTTIEEQARTVGIKLYATQKVRSCNGHPDAFCWTFDPASRPTLSGTSAAAPKQLPPEGGISCPGDSGGPFLLPHAASGTRTWQVAGVISAGDPVACGAKTTAYNMRLGADIHRNWLDFNIQEMAQPAPTALQLKKTDSVRFGALGVVDPANEVVGHTSRTIEVPYGIRRLRLAVNAADLRSGGPLTLQLRRPPSTEWQNCQATGGAFRMLAQGGLQTCELDRPAPGSVEVRLSGRLGREIQFLATHWAEQ